LTLSVVVVVVVVVKAFDDDDGRKWRNAEIDGNGR
jgi:hypothetical protein